MYKSHEIAKEYHSYYNWRILGYVDLTFCTITIISNVLVILVLAMKKMFPLDLIFTHIAITESLTALALAPHVWHSFIRAALCSIPEHRTLIWETISTYSITFTIVFRTIATWLAVMLAVWRYMAVIHPLKARVWCNMQSTKIFIVIGYVFSFLTNTILFNFSMEIHETVIPLDQNGCFTHNSSIGTNTTVYIMRSPLQNNVFWYTLMTIYYAIFLKIVPSLVVSIIVYKLVVVLLQTKKSNEEMSLNSHHYYRITLILILVCLLFVIADVPHGIGALLGAIYGFKFYKMFFYNAMEILNTLLYMSGSFNFIIYYTMSDQFRRTFKKLIKCHSVDSTPVEQNVCASPTAKSFRTINQSSNFRDININTAQVD